MSDAVLLVLGSKGFDGLTQRTRVDREKVQRLHSRIHHNLEVVNLGGPAKKTKEWLLM